MHGTRHARPAPYTRILPYLTRPAPYAPRSPYINRTPYKPSKKIKIEYGINKANVYAPSCSFHYILFEVPNKSLIYKNLYRVFTNIHDMILEDNAMDIKIQKWDLIFTINFFDFYLQFHVAVY